MIENDVQTDIIDTCAAPHSSLETASAVDFILK
jgi:hypothetical protein